MIENIGDCLGLDEGNDMDKNKKLNDQTLNIRNNDDNDQSENKSDFKGKHDNKYRLTSLLKLKNTNTTTFTPYLHVRSDGQFSCDEDLQNKNNLHGVFYLKIIVENKDYYDDFSSHIIHDDYKYNHHKDNKYSYKKTEEIVGKITATSSSTSSSSSSSCSSRRISDEELRIFFTDGFLKISNAVDQSSIDSCLR